MFSDYSVTGFNKFSSGSPNGYSALVVRKHSRFDEEKRKVVANLSDDEIVLASINYAEKKTDKTVAGKLANALPSLFVTAAPLILGALAKGSLSDKAKTALSTGLIFGGALTLFNKYDKGTERIENASKTIKEAREKHPVIAKVFDYAAKALLACGAGYAVIKSGKYLQNKFKPTADMLNKSVEKASKKIDESLLGRGVQKLNDRADVFFDKHPKLSEFVSKNSYLAPGLALIGWLGFETAVLHSAFNKKLDFAEDAADKLLYEREMAKAGF